MNSDLHFWNLQKVIQRKSINEKFHIWVDRYNKLEIERQINQHNILLPHLKEEDRSFRLDNSRLYML